MEEKQTLHHYDIKHLFNNNCFTCSFCCKKFERKTWYKEHVALCKLNAIANNIDEGIIDDSLYNNEQLVKMVSILCRKVINLENHIKKINTELNRTKIKINIDEIINEKLVIKDDTEFKNIMPYIIETLPKVFDYELISCIIDDKAEDIILHIIYDLFPYHYFNNEKYSFNKLSDIYETIQEHKQPLIGLKKNECKKNIYILNNNQWIPFTMNHMNIFINQIQKHLFNEYIKWNDNMKEYYKNDEHCLEKHNEKCNKFMKKIINIQTFSEHQTLIIKNKISNKYCFNLRNVFDYEIEI